MRAFAFCLSLLCASCGAQQSAPASVPGSCDKSLAVQILGSGGPIQNGERASSSYAIFVNDEARLLVDLGPGSFSRLKRAGASTKYIERILLSHYHVDHSADLPVFLKAASFLPARENLIVAGPSGNELFPSLGEFYNALVGEIGAYRYLSGFLTGVSKGAPVPFKVELQQVHAGGSQVQDLGSFLNGRGKVEALSVEHGKVPALAYRIQIDSKRIVFTGDQRMLATEMVEFARDADILVAHHAIAEQTSGVAAKLHAKPSGIAKLAKLANVKTLVLSHHMKRSLDHRRQSMTIVSKSANSVQLANDLDCYSLKP